MKTTLDLPEELIREMKVRAAREGRKLKDVAAEVFRLGMAQPATLPSHRPSRVRLPLIDCPQTPGQGQDPDPDVIASLLTRQEAASANETAGH